LTRMMSTKRLQGRVAQALLGLADGLGTEAIHLRPQGAVRWAGGFAV
jgi:hypothetical protein